MTWHHFCLAGAAPSRDGMEQSQNLLAHGCQLCTQLSIFEGGLAKLFRLWRCQVIKIEEVSQSCFAFVYVVKVKNRRISQNCFALDVVKLKTEGVWQTLYNYNYSCATPHYHIQQPLPALQKTQLQAPVSPSMDLLCHL